MRDRRGLDGARPNRKVAKIAGKNRVRRAPAGCLKKLPKWLKHADFAAPMRQLDEPNQVEHQRRREQ